MLSNALTNVKIMTFVLMICCKIIFANFIEENHCQTHLDTRLIVVVMMIFGKLLY